MAHRYNTGEKVKHLYDSIVGLNKTLYLKVKDFGSITENTKFRVKVYSFDTVKYCDIVRGFDSKFVVNTTHGGCAIIDNASVQLVNVLDGSENIEKVIILSINNTN